MSALASATAFWRGVAAALGDGHAVFVALVAAASDHSPGTAGALLLLAADGRQRGTVGGGVMELRILDRARELLRDPRRLIERVELVHRRDADGEGEPSGMICAGRQTNLYLVLRPDHDSKAVQSLVRRLDDESPATLTIDSENGLAVGAGDAHDRRLEVDGDRWRYVEPTFERRRVAILGAGHCGTALARRTAELGWRVTIFETRAEVARGTELDGVASVRVVPDFRDAAGQIAHPALTPAVVMTTDVPNDVRALEGLLRVEELPFVGLMGAPAKLDEIRRRLRRLGFGDDHLDRITAPVGLPIGSRTPGEIAISVAAQLLGERHRWLHASGVSA